MVEGLNGPMTAFTAGLFFSAGFSVFIAIFLQRWSDVAGVRQLTAQMVLQAVWTLSVAFEVLSVGLETKIFFHALSRLGVLGVPLSWFYFVFKYTGQQRWLTRGLSMALMVLTTFLILAAFTNQYHHLVWNSITLTPDGTGAVFSRGPLYWVTAGLSYALLLSALLDLLWIGLSSSSVDKIQAITLIVAGGAPGVAGIAYMLGLTGPNDYTTYAFVVVGGLTTWVIARFRYYNLIPVARTKLMATLPDGILALDAAGRVIDMNPAFQRVAGLKDPGLGRPYDELLAASKDMLALLRGGSVNSRKVFFDLASACFYEVSISELEINPKAPKGRLVILRDVTQAERSAQAQRSSEENIRRLFDANPFPMAILGKEDSSIYQVNQATLDYFKVTRAEMIGLRGTSFFAGLDLRDQVLNELKTSGQVRSRMVEVKHPSGKRTHVVLSIYPVDYYGMDRWLVTFADISERRRIEENERAQRILGEAILEISSLLTSTLDLEEVLDRILDNVSRLVQYEGLAITVVDEHGVGNVLRARGYTERGRVSPLGTLRLVVAETPNLRKMAQTHRVISIPDVTRDREWVHFPGREWMRAYMGAPMFTEGGIAGFISVEHSIAGFYNQADISRLEVFAAQAGIAIQNARLVSRIQKAARETEILQEIARTVSSSLDFDLVIDRIFELISRLVLSDSVGVHMIDGNEFVLRAFRETGKDKVELGLRWKLEGTANERVLLSRSPIIFPDVQKEFPEYRVDLHNKIRSVLMIPLISGGNVIGFLSLDSWTTNHFTSDDERLASAFANSIAVALENSVLYVETQKRLKIQSSINEISAALASTLTTQDLLDAVWQQVNRFLDAGYLTVVMQDLSNRGWAVCYVREGGKLTAPQNEMNVPAVIQHVIGSRVPVFLRQRSEIEMFVRVTGVKMASAEQKSLMVVPMQVSGTVTGAMEIFSFDHDLAFSQDDFELFGSIASQVAISLENSRLFEETRKRVEEMEILNRVALAITSGLDRERLLLTLFDQCSLVMTVDTFFVALFNDMNEMLEYPLFYDQGYFRDVAPVARNDLHELAAAVLNERRTRYVANLCDNDEMLSYLPGHSAANLCSCVGVPMNLRDQTIGVIAALSVKPNAYSREQIHLLEMISTQTAIAIDNVRLYSEAQLLATTDFLTGMLNRRELFVRADQEFDRARRYRHDLALMMVDIDHFKQVNDTYGHLTGDQVLRSLSRVCQKTMRHVDVLGRYGGEEILILMPETSAEKALAAAERLRSEISEMAVDSEAGEIFVTVSIGLTSYRHERGTSLEQLISQADSSLFAAKAAGRNRVCIYGTNQKSGA